VSAKVFLATTALSEFWETNCRIVFLGKWCLPYGSLNQLQQIPYEVLNYPWDDRIAFKRAVGYCNGIYEDLLLSLSDCMNVIHGVNRSNRYWRIILGPWLLYYIHAFYDRYSLLKGAFAAYPGLETVCLSQESYVTPIDLADFKGLSVGDLYNLQLFSQIFVEMGYTFPVRRHGFAARIAAPKIKCKTFKTFKNRLKTFAKKGSKVPNMIAARLTSKWMFHLYIGANNVLKIWLKSWLTIWPILPVETHGLVPDQIDKELRKQLVVNLERNCQDSSRKILVRTLFYNIPLVYIEGYGKIRNYVSKCFPSCPNAIVSSVGWFTDEVFKVLAAEKSEEGTLLVGVQHEDK